MRFEGAVFAVEGAFGAAAVAEHEVVHFELFGSPVRDGLAAGGEEEVVILTDATEALPFSLSGAEDEVPFERGFAGLIAAEPGGVEEFPTFVGFNGRQNESAGTGSVAQGVHRGFFETSLTGRTGVATVAFFGWGLLIRRWRRGRRFFWCCCFTSLVDFV